MTSADASMPANATGNMPTRPTGLALLLNRQRLLFCLGASLLLGLLNSLPSEAPTPLVMARALLVGLAVMLAFGLFEQWPARLPPWLARWALQLLAVVLVIPPSAWLSYWITLGGDPQFAADYQAPDRPGLPELQRRAVRPLGRAGRDRAPARGLRPPSGRGLRAGAQRVRAPGARCPAAAAAGPGAAALPLQHPGQCALAGAQRLGAGRPGAGQPDRLSARRRAAAR